MLSQVQFHLTDFTATVNNTNIENMNLRLWPFFYVIANLIYQNNGLNFATTYLHSSH